MDHTNRDNRQARGAGRPFCPGWCYQPGQKGVFCPGCQTRDKRAPAWQFRLGNQQGVSQPGQISISVVVIIAYVGITLINQIIREQICESI